MRVAAGRILIGAYACLSGCSQPADEGPGLPWAAEALSAPDLPEDEGRAELGRLLFYDPVLSADGDTACATCHSEIWGMSDGLPRSIGTGGSLLTGPGRVGDNTTRRNAQTLWNAGYRESLFWDGRSDSLEAQALMPLREATELGREPDALADALAQMPAYRDLFAEAFPGHGEPTPARIASALAAFERTLLSNRAPYDRYLAGDNGALDEASLRGMWLFAEAGCATCHAPPRFERDRFADRRIQGASESGDDGRFEATGEAADRGLFRVPTLRNLRETGPYFHAGQIRELPAAVAHEVEVQVQDGVCSPLSEDELSDLVAFIDKALMDRSREPDRPETVPSGLPVPIDGFRIPR